MLVKALNFGQSKQDRHTNIESIILRYQMINTLEITHSLFGSHLMELFIGTLSDTHLLLLAMLMMSKLFFG